MEGVEENDPDPSFVYCAPPVDNLSPMDVCLDYGRLPLSGVVGFKPENLYKTTNTHYKIRSIVGPHRGTVR